MGVESLIPFQPPVAAVAHITLLPPCAPIPSEDSLGWLSKFQPPVPRPPRVERVHVAAPPWSVPFIFPYTATPGESFLPLTYKRFDYKTAQVIVGLTVGPLTTPAVPTPTPEVACALTLSELNARTARSLDDPNMIYWTPDEYTWAVNVSQRLFCLITRCLEREASFTLVNGQAIYDDIRLQITDFLLPLRVNFSGTRLTNDLFHSLDMRDSIWRNRAGNPVRYSMLGWKMLAITPQPATGSNTLDVFYAAEPPELVNAGDLAVIAPEQQIFLPDAAHWILRLKEGGTELQNAKPYLERFTTAAGKYAKFIESRSGGQTYDTPPFDTNSFEMGRFNLKLKQVPGPVPPTMKRQQ